MSTASSKQSDLIPIPWNMWWGIIFVVLVYYVSQILGGVVVSIYPGLQHWSHNQAIEWLNNSVVGQFTYILIAESLAIGAVYWFLRRRKLTLAVVGLKKPRLSDVGYGVIALPAYFALYVTAVGLASHFVPTLDINQKQQIGFENVAGPAAMLMTFISLVILPPLAEEIMIRGFLYSSLRKALKIVPAAIITSLIFAAAHLPEGGASGPLYIAAIDTFILSLVLVYLREKTSSLWASITLHAIKNCIAFIALFVVGTR